MNKISKINKYNRFLKNKISNNNNNNKKEKKKKKPGQKFLVGDMMGYRESAVFLVGYIKLISKHLCLCPMVSDFVRKAFFLQ